MATAAMSAFAHAMARSGFQPRKHFSSSLPFLAESQLVLNGCQVTDLALEVSERSDGRFDDTEREYWTTASVLVGLSLHWHALRRKLSQAIAS